MEGLGGAMAEFKTVYTQKEATGVGAHARTGHWRVARDFLSYAHRQVPTVLGRTQKSFYPKFKETTFYFPLFILFCNPMNYLL
jgi:hypothetical protein